MPRRLFYYQRGKMAIKETRKLSDNIKVKTAGFFGQILFLLNSHIMTFKNVNHPDVENHNYVFAVLHSQQCGLYSILNRENMFSMISRSTDGDLVALSGGRVGINSVRGSSKRGGATAALELIDKVKNGYSAALAIDGPRGPVGVVKPGVVQIAKNGGAPIIPMAWQTKSKYILKLPTWDKLLIPLLFVKAVALYGEPIDVPSDATEEQMEEIRLKVENEIKRLNEELANNYDEYYKKGIRNTHHSKSVVSWF